MQLRAPKLLSLLPLFIVIILDVVGIVLVFPILAPLILKVDGSIMPVGISPFWRDFCFGLAIAIFPLMVFFSTPILGNLSDKYGRKKILVICLVGGAIGYLISAIGIPAKNIYLFLLGRAVAGTFSGTQPLANAVIIDLSAPGQKTTNLSYAVLVAAIGLIVGPILGGITADAQWSNWFSYQTPFLLAALFSLLNAVFLHFTLRDRRQLVDVDQPLQLTKGFQLFLLAFTRRQFRNLSISCFCFILAWCLYFQAIGWFFMKNYAYTTVQLGFFMGYIGIVFMLCTSLVLHRVLRICVTEIRAYLVCIFLMMVANLGAAMAQQELTQWLWALVNAGSQVMAYTISLTLFSNLAGEQDQGWIMGVTGAISAMAWTVGGLCAGPLGFIHVTVPLWVAAALCLISLVCMVPQRMFIDSI